MITMATLIKGLPKAELHIHLEGSIEAELMFKLAQRNGIDLPYTTEAELRAAYRFSNLQSFLDIYYAGLTVLRHEQDFYDMTWEYLQRAQADHVLHSEMFISPQAHLRRGIRFATMFTGIDKACADAMKKWGLSTRLILGVQRHLSEEDAYSMIEQALAYRNRIAGIGLGGPEVDHPPRKFEKIFAHCRKLGWHVVAHAGEEGPAAYVAEAVDLLKVERIDHGVRCEEDPSLLTRLVRMQTPLTVCPISNIKLRVFDDLKSHNLKRLLDAGLRVTINSDDPSYFGAYVNTNFIACQRELGLSTADIYRLAHNSFGASFLPQQQKAVCLEKLDSYWLEHGLAIPEGFNEIGSPG